MDARTAPWIARRLETACRWTLLTGFLGSGKTTLLRRALSAPEFSDTAVVINEIGEIAIDHFLVDFVEGEVLELPGGCLCCAVREDLAQTLRSLIERRDAGDIRRSAASSSKRAGWPIPRRSCSPSAPTRCSTSGCGSAGW